MRPAVGERAGGAPTAERADAGALGGARGAMAAQNAAVTRAVGVRAETSVREDTHRPTWYSKYSTVQ